MTSNKSDELDADYRRNPINPVQVTDDSTDQTKSPKKKILIEVDEDDPCLKREEVEEKPKEPEFFFTGDDPRFQQQNQTLRCYVMYTDFYRCEHILGAGSNACSWFKQVFTTICPNEWIRRMDDLRVANKLPWHGYKKQGNFPGDKYGV
nr:cytochrome c oxidase subunit 12, mitochondrial-like [Osmia lignaria]